MNWAIRLGDFITSVTVFVYALLAVLYVLGGLHNKALYWVGACVLTFAVLRMQ